ncbi:hypothetical protein PS874_01361 [Pseudomonas fluorescens]|uniref:Uncharacterized protein n=1 Tax=Pseudomonas silesiensis TaxID=1853130 RepID=A0A191YSW0_9PSED|nr:hypothetical protein PMA3_12770 [Pseudomonas silesiensis]VVO74890.1 hypothetical protein PS874_01361 [Pseudomonas fluorescens]
MSHESLGLISLMLFPPFLLLAIWLIYMVHVYTERAEALMINSSFIEANRSLFSQMGLIGKAMRNGLLTLALLTPTLAAKRGLVNVADVKNFPIGLRRILFLSWGSSFVFSVALVVLNVFRRYSY